MEDLTLTATLTATYSPDDNKLRLYALSRLDTQTYERLKAAGFKWAPRQQLFFAPMWTPGREDLLMELCGEIGDEDKSLVERAEERAERFGQYSEHRAQDSDAAHRAVHAIAYNIPLGQPVLVGHHSERHHRKDIERIDNGMRRAVKMWETAQYWKARAAGALQHAKYKELPVVRRRRIKTLEAEMRKQERYIDEAQNHLTLWSAPALDLVKATAVANHDYISCCFPLAKFPRELPASQYEGQMSLWSALDSGVINEHQARDIAIPTHQRVIARARRWIAHYENRITYERAMLDEQDGVKPERFDIQPGGRVLIRDTWQLVVRVNRTGGAINSVTTDEKRYPRVHGIEEIQDYVPPNADDAAAVKKATKLPPLVNFPGEGFIEMTAAEYKRRPSDYKGARRAEAKDGYGAYRYRTSFVPGSSYRIAQVYLTDVKRVDIPKATERPEGDEGEIPTAPSDE
jgi:hypothetical protein